MNSLVSIRLSGRTPALAWPPGTWPPPWSGGVRWLECLGIAVIDVHVDARVSVRTYMYSHMCLCTCICVWPCAKYTRTHKYKSMVTYVYIYIHTHVCIFVYMYIYMYTYSLCVPALWVIDPRLGLTFQLLPARVGTSLLTTVLGNLQRALPVLQSREISYGPMVS